MTLDTYAGLFEDDLEALADRLDERISTTIVAQSLPKDTQVMVEIAAEAVSAAFFSAPGARVELATYGLTVRRSAN